MIHLYLSTYPRQAKILSKEYKALPDSEKKHWEKKAAADKKRYQAEMKHYVPPPDEGGKRRGKKAKKDPNKPKRNLSAYFLFSVSSSKNTRTPPSERLPR